MQPIVSGAPVCPVDVSAVSQDGLAVTVNFDTPSIDSMGRQVTAVCSPQPGSLFEVGTHEVMCERPNDPGARCTFPLTVLANTDPVGGGICDRTVQVRDAIVDRIPGIHTCSAVTDAHLAMVTGLLNLNNTGITSLKSGDFSGLTYLRSLLLKNNRLTTLPVDIFAGLVSLETLRVNANALQSLPRHVFAGLVRLNILDLEYNTLTTLPTGIFADLNLRFLGLEANQFHTLQAGLFDALSGSLILDVSHNALTMLEDGVFTGLGDLVWLDLASNRLQALPTGVFAGLTRMQALYLEGNPGADFMFTMTLERVPDTNKVAVVVPEGAPFDMITTISVTAGTLPTGVSAVTVPAGHTRSEEIAITPLTGATVSLGEAPPVPVFGFDGIATAVGNPLVSAGIQGRSVQGLPGLSLADTKVQEGADAVLAFVVMLNRSPSARVTVNWATADGTAKAGVDYTPARGTLTFTPGQTAKTVSVLVLDDVLDEGSETLKLALSNPSGAYIADGEATGTINNFDPIPMAWLARFGRTVAGQVTDAIEERLWASRATGVSINLAGQSLGVEQKPQAEAKSWEHLMRLSDGLEHEMQDDERVLPSRTLTGHEILMGSSFSFAGEMEGGGMAAVWGRMAQSSFNGREDELGLDGITRDGLCTRALERGSCAVAQLERW